MVKIEEEPKDVIEASISKLQGSFNEIDVNKLHRCILSLVLTKQEIDICVQYLKEFIGSQGPIDPTELLQKLKDIAGPNASLKIKNLMPRFNLKEVFSDSKAFSHKFTETYLEVFVSRKTAEFIIPFVHELQTIFNQICNRMVATHSRYAAERLHVALCSSYPKVNEIPGLVIYFRYQLKRVTKPSYYASRFKKNPLVIFDSAFLDEISNVGESIKSYPSIREWVRENSPALPAMFEDSSGFASKYPLKSFGKEADETESLRKRNYALQIEMELNFICHFFSMYADKELIKKTYDEICSLKIGLDQLHSLLKYIESCKTEFESSVTYALNIKTNFFCFFESEEFVAICGAVPKKLKKAMNDLNGSCRIDCSKEKAVIKLRDKPRQEMHGDAHENTVYDIKNPRSGRF